MKKLISLMLSLVMLCMAVSSSTAYARGDTIQDGDTLTVSVAAGAETTVSFSPEKSGIYRLTSDADQGIDPAVNIFKDSAFYREADDTAAGENFDVSCYFDAGSQYSFRLAEVLGKAAEIRLTLAFVTGVDSVAFAPAAGGYVYYENSGVYPKSGDGDTVTVTFENGTLKAYVYQTSLADYYCTESGTYISGDFGSVPEILPVFDESTGAFLDKVVFRFLGVTHEIDVTRAENPVSAIRYQPAKPIYLVENVSGINAEDDGGSAYFLYFFHVGEGDVLTVTYTDGATDTFTLVNENGAFRFADAYGRTPDADYFSIDYLNGQMRRHWALGTNYFTVSYYGSEWEVPVNVVKPGWQKISGKWYYFSNKDDNPVTGWQKIGGKWYLFAYADGHMLTGWVKSGGKWYYFNTSGAMQTGWQKISGKWYYFNASGAMLTGWQKIGGKWYLFANANGNMLTGWVKSGGKWYYFNASGAMQTGWQKISGKWYYFESSGAMLANTSKKIGRKTYKFNSSGVCTNP